MSYKIDYAYSSHKGNVRENNEDNFWCMGSYMLSDALGTEGVNNGKPAKAGQSLLAVFDGMGGESCGEKASEAASLACDEFYCKYAKKMKMKPEKYLQKLVAAMNQSVCDYAGEHHVLSMGTTAALLFFHRRSVYCCNLGDSRIYEFSDNTLTQCSVDHIAGRGFLKKAPLTQFLGIPNEEMTLEPNMKAVSYADGKMFLACSDGLTDSLNDQQICDILRKNSSLSDTVKNLEEEALHCGGRDNITMILCQVLKEKSFFNV